MRRIYLIDCPGVVYPSAETDAEKVLKGVVRVELVQNPEDYVSFVLERVRPEYMQKTYKVDHWDSTIDFLEKLAARTGKLLKGGEPDTVITARMVLNDWQRGKLPFYVVPPGYESKNLSENGNEIKEDKTEISVKETDTPEKACEVESKEDDKSENKLTVVQDFRKIRVGLEFGEEDDIKELEPIHGLDDSKKKNKQKVKKIQEEEDSSDFSDFYSHSEGEYDEAIFESPSKAKKSKIQSGSGVFEVEVVSNPTKKTNQAEPPVKKLTSRQRRALERAQMRRKTGSTFYKETNVKNRNRNKRKPI